MGTTMTERNVWRRLYTVAFSLVGVGTCGILLGHVLFPQSNLGLNPVFGPEIAPTDSI